MPTSEEHQNQALHNLQFLKEVNSHCNNYYDWQVTVCFYSSLHFINAHLNKVDIGVDFATHELVDQYIRPHGRIRKTQLEENTYASYRALQTLSRRARYLRNDKNPDKAAFTGEKHFGKAIYHLDQIMTYMKETYHMTFDTVELTCERLKKQDCHFFQHL